VALWIVAFASAAMSTCRAVREWTTPRGSVSYMKYSENEPLCIPAKPVPANVALVGLPPPGTRSRIV